MCEGPGRSQSPGPPPQTDTNPFKPNTGTSGPCIHGNQHTLRCTQIVHTRGHPQTCARPRSTMSTDGSMFLCPFNQLAVHVHHTSTHRAAHASAHACTLPQKCASGYTHPQKGTKSIDGHTGTSTLSRACRHFRPKCVRIRTPTPNSAQSARPPPADVPTPGDLQLQKRTGSFPGLVPGSRQGPGAAEGAQPRAKTPRPPPARRPPSPWMPVWCAMAPCPAPPAPSEPSARP